MNFTWNALKCSLFWPDQLPNNQIQYAINLDKGTKAPKNLIHHRNATRVYALFLILIVHLFPAFTGEWRCLTCLPLESEFLRGPIEKKCHKKGKKSTIFLPPPPRMIWTFLNLGKIGNLMISYRNVFVLRWSYGSHLSNEVSPSILACLKPEKLSKNCGAFLAA